MSKEKTGVDEAPAEPKVLFCKYTSKIPYYGKLSLRGNNHKKGQSII